MAQTFTGLKLKGELGRFGKTEICDVLGVYPMPDEKVIKCSSNKKIFSRRYNYIFIFSGIIGM